MVELYDGQAWPKPSPGPTVDPPKDPLHREFGTHDRGPKRTLSGMHGSWQPRPGSRLVRFRITALANGHASSLPRKRRFSL